MRESKPAPSEFSQLNELQPIPKASCADCASPSKLDFRFDFAYQPIVDLENRCVFAHEALVRGPNGEGAMTVLEKVNESNRYRFDQACRVKAIKGASQLGMREYLSINFLPNSVYKPEQCIRATLEAARAHDFPLERIVFEATEGERISDAPWLINIFREYKRFGFLTAIDDFGAGFAGLNLLAQFQPDIVKLDMELIRNVPTSPSRQAIVKAVIAMCRDLGIRVIAEGIETADERDFLHDAGVRLMQGYFFARPSFESLAQVRSEAWR